MVFSFKSRFLENCVLGVGGSTSIDFSLSDFRPYFESEAFHTHITRSLLQFLSFKSLCVSVSPLTHPERITYSIEHLVSHRDRLVSPIRPDIRYLGLGPYCAHKIKASGHSKKGSVPAYYSSVIPGFHAVGGKIGISVLLFGSCGCGSLAVGHCFAR